MYFTKNFILSLCLTVASSLQLGDECVVNQNGYSKGRCQILLECDYVLMVGGIPGYCDKAKGLVCCPPVTFEGGSCFDGLSGVIGKCQKALDCNYYALNYHKKIKYCSDRTVCCPPFQLRLSEKMCLEYHTDKDIGAGGVQADNVTAGKKALRKSSHMAVIGFTENDKITWGCGGSIISPFFILSAAHCVIKYEELGSAEWVRIRDLDQLYFITEGVSHQDFRILQTFIHSNYTSSSYHDIALFKLEEEIIFGDNYQPACLHTKTNVPEIMEETSWGLHPFVDDRAPYLLRELKVIEYKTCAIMHRHDREELPNGVKDELQICAWDTSEEETCPVKFGNVLHYKVEGFGNVRGHHVVAGIGSFGYCSPGVFSRVSAYLDWIEGIVWEDEIESETVTFVFTN